MKHLMVDLETLAVTPEAVILSLGACHFDPMGNGVNDTLYFRINFEQQETLKREVDPNTVEWWQKQDPEIIEEAFNPENRIDIHDAVNQFHKFAWGCDAFWSHGAPFDLVIIENLYRQLNKPLPWNFWQLRDTRTIFDLGLDPEMPKDNKHNALQDAIRQAIGVQNIYTKLGLSKK